MGGGNIPKAGEISLAHRGVLFLDEFPEFGTRVLEVMRQPMEDKVVTISRAKGSLAFPANFQLIAAIASLYLQSDVHSPILRFSIVAVGLVFPY